MIRSFIRKQGGRYKKVWLVMHGGP
jgi:hypothetical protein